MSEPTFICTRCHSEIPMSDRREFDGRDYCPRCLDAITAVCHICGTRFTLTNNHGTEDTPLCEDCLHTHNAKGICEHSFKPTPIFYGKGPRYFGVELEIDDGGEYDSSANEIMAVANTEREYIYIKHDGSLDDGMEIVSHPMSIDYHMNVAPWAEVVEKARALDYCSHKAGTCGLHVHVSRAAFGATEEAQDAVIARILYFFEKHWEELLKFSRRTQKQLEDWASRYGYKAEPKEILDHAKGGGRNRYSAVNLTNTDTVEFRLFRGTLKLNTFLATLQLLDRICDVASNLSDDDLKDLSWTTFVSGCDAPELVQYLKERRLYVNDPVELAEEEE